MRAHIRPSVVIALVASLVAAPLAAQSLRGTVRDDDTGERLEGVHVVLLSEANVMYSEAFSDEEGRFALNVPEPGTWVVATDLIGYGPLGSEPIAIAAEDQITVEIRMSVKAIPLEPVVVTSRRSFVSPDIRDFYERVERGKRFGFGRFITREDVDRRMPSHVTDLLWAVPGVRIVSAGRVLGVGGIVEMSRGCTPAIYVDGIQINRLGADMHLDAVVSPSAVEGIEVYRGGNQQGGRYFDSRGCGLILVWTRRGSDDGNPFSWGRLLAVAGIVLGVFLLN